MKNGDRRHFIRAIKPLATPRHRTKRSTKTIVLRDEGKVLNPGDYQVEWSGTGPNDELNIVQGRDTLATVPARVVSENTSNEHDGYVLQPARNGGESIEEIFFSGAKY